MRLSIAGTFTVNTVEDGAQGAPSPYYHAQTYAWSEQMTTANSLTSPSDIGANDWAAVLPTQTVSTKRFLWMRDILMTYDPTAQGASQTGYVAGTPSYARLNGEDGTGFHPRGSVPTVADLNGIQAPEVGDAYLVEADGHIYVFNGSTWDDFGVVKGDDGLSAYIHLAWANAVGAGGYPTGGNPDGSAMGFTTSKAATETYAWMGIYADNEPTDSQTPSRYQWSRIRGLNRRLDLDNENDTMLYDSKGTLLSGNVESTVTLYEDGVPVRNSSVRYDVATTGIPPLRATISLNPTTYVATLTVRGMEADTATVTVTATYQGQTYQAVLTLKRLVGQEKYSLVTTPTAIAYNLTTGVPATTDVLINITRLDAEGSVSSLTDDTIGSLTLSVTDGTDTITPTYDSTARAWKFTAYGTRDEYTVTLRDGDIILDRETIPVNKSANGDDAVRYYIQLNHDNVVVDYDASVQMTVTADFLKQVGSSSAPEAVAKYVQMVIHNADGSTYVPAASPSSTDSTWSNAVAISRNIAKVVAYMLDAPNTQRTVPVTYLAKAEMVVTVNGQQGAQGLPGNAGKDIVRLDLDNQMDAMQYNGTTKKTASVITHASLYEGTSLVSTGMTWGSITATGCTASMSQSGNPRTVTVTAVSADTATVTIPVTYKGVTYIAVFTVIKLTDNDKYELRITPTAIAWNEDTDTGTRSVTARIFKSPYKNGVPDYITTLDGNTMTVTPYKADGTAGTAITPTYSSQEKGWTFNAAPATYDRYVVTITNGGIMQDTETISVARVKNGLTGANSIRLSLDNDMDAMQYNGSDKVTPSVSTRATLYDGGSPVTLPDSAWSFTAQGCTASKGTASGVSMPFTVSALSAEHGLLTIKATYNGQEYTAVFSVVRITDGAKYQLELKPTAISYNRNTAPYENLPVSIKIKKYHTDGSTEYLSSLGTLLELIVIATDSLDENARHVYGASEISYSSEKAAWIFYTDCETYDTYNIELLCDGDTADMQDVVVARCENGENGAPGSSPYTLDLSNEMDSVPMDNEGYVTGSSAITLTTTASLYYGATRQSLSALTASAPGVEGVTVNADPSTGLVTVTLRPDTYEEIAFDNDRLVVTVTATHGSGASAVTRSADFTIQGVRAGSEGNSPTIYQLAINTKEIKVSKDGVRVPQQSAITVARTATMGTTTSATTHGSIWYVKDNASAVKWIDGATMDAFKDPFATPVLNNITFRYYDGSTQNTPLLDSESIPVVYDGTDGENPYWLDFKACEAYVDQSGTAHVSLRWIVKKGTDSIPNENHGSCWIKYSNKSAWESADYIQGSNYDWDQGSVDGSDYDGSSHVLIYYEDENEETRASASIPISKYGQNGNNGADAVSYEIRTDMDSVTIPSDQDSKKIDSFTLSFWKTVGAKAAASFTGGFVVYSRKGSSYNRIYRHASLVSSMTFSGTSAPTVTTSIDALVIFLNSSVYPSSSASAAPTQYLAKKEIPILKRGDTGQDGGDGAPGVSPTVYEIVVVSAEAYIDATGKMHGDVYWDVYSIQGTTRTKIDTACVTGSVHQWRLNTDNWQSTGSAVSNNHSWTNGAYNNKKWSDDLRLQNMPTSVDLRYVKGGAVVATASVSITVQGQMGRNYYYDGEYSSSRVYTLTDYSAPYVSYTPSGGATAYYMLTGDNGSSTRPVPSDTTGNPWKLMESSFKYIISEAIFTAFAKLGSAVFNQDFMFSQHGYATGFGGLKRKIETGAMYQYVKPDNMDGEVPLNDADTIWNASPRRDIGTGGGWEQINSCVLNEGWYTFMIEGRGAMEGESLNWKIGETSSSVPLAQGTIGYISDYVYGSDSVIFYNDSDDTTLYLYCNDSTDGDGAYLNFYALHPCGFTPSLYIDLRTGEMVANDIKARGILYADGLYYKAALVPTYSSGSATEYIPVGEESVVVLGTGGFINKDYIVTLPSPTEADGRRIELFCYKRSLPYKVQWEGMDTDHAYFYKPWGGTGPNGRDSWQGVAHAIFWCYDGGWYVLQKESVYYNNGRNYMLNDFMEQ